MNKYFQEATATVIMPWTNFFIIVIPASANLVLIRAHDHLTFPPMTAILSLSITVTLICVLAFPVAGSIHSSSISYLAAFRQSHIVPMLALGEKKRIRGLKPLKIHIGTLTFIRAITVLKLINSIIYWTMRSLLIYRK